MEPNLIEYERTQAANRLNDKERNPHLTFDNFAEQSEDIADAVASLLSMGVTYLGLPYNDAIKTLADYTRCRNRERVIKALSKREGISYVFRRRMINKMKSQFRYDGTTHKQAMHSQLATLQKWKRKIIALDNFLFQAHHEISVALPSELADGVTYEGFEISNDRVKLKFHVPKTKIHAGRYGKRWIGKAQYQVEFKYMNSGEYLYVDTYSYPLGSTRINPHASGGDGGWFCLGSAAYEVSTALADNDWLGLAITLQRCHNSVNINDEYGEQIKHNEQVYYIHTREGRKDLTREQMRSLPEKYISGHKVMLQDDYVRCCVTGKYMKRENAVRVPLFVHPDAIKQRSHDFVELEKKIKNKPDQARLDHMREELWAKHHRKNMDNYHKTAALDEDRALRKAFGDLNGRPQPVRGADDLRTFIDLARR